MHAYKAGVIHLLMCPPAPVATAVQSLRGTEDIDGEHKAVFLFSISKGHQVSWMLGCVEMTFSKAWNLKNTDNSTCCLYFSI